MDIRTREPASLTLAIATLSRDTTFIVLLKVLYQCRSCTPYGYPASLLVSDIWTPINIGSPQPATLDVLNQRCNQKMIDCFATKASTLRMHQWGRVRPVEGSLASNIPHTSHNRRGAAQDPRTVNCPRWGNRLSMQWLSHPVNNSISMSMKRSRWNLSPYCLSERRRDSRMRRSRRASTHDSRQRVGLGNRKLVVVCGLLRPC